MKVIKKQSNAKDCIVCGIANPYGLHASFYEMEDHTLVALFSFNEHHQSYPERTHGGLISAILDETIGRAIWIDEPECYGCTIKLNVSFHKGVPYNTPLRCIARIDKKDAISFHGVGEIQTEDGTLLARAEALYMRLTLKQIAPSMGSEHFHPEELNIDVPDNVQEIDIAMKR